MKNIFIKKTLLKLLMFSFTTKLAFVSATATHTPMPDPSLEPEVITSISAVKTGLSTQSINEVIGLASTASTKINEEVERDENKKEYAIALAYKSNAAATNVETATEKILEVQTYINAAKEAMNAI